MMRAPLLGRAAGDDYETNENGDRAIARRQPEPRDRPGLTAEVRAHNRWTAMAEVAKKRTGKASGWTFESRQFRAATREEVLAARESFLKEYQITRKRKAKSSHLEEQQPEDVSRERRACAPTSLKLPKLNPGPQLPVPGPGRGRSYEPELSIRQQMNEILPPQEALVATNWLKLMQLKSQWKSDRIQQLEKQVEELLAANEKQAQELTTLRDQVGLQPHIV